MDWLVIMALAFSIIVPFYFIEKQDRLNEAENQLKQVIALESLYIERWNQEKLDAIRRFAISDNAEFHRIGDLRREIQDYSRVNSEFASINYVEKDGYIRADTDTNIKIYVGDQPFYKQALQKKNYISGIVTSKETGTPIITFSSPVLGDHDVTAVSQYIQPDVGKTQDEHSPSGANV